MAAQVTADDLAALVWPAATAIVYAIAFRHSIGQWRRHRDRRAWTNLIADLSLFIAAGCVVVSSVLIIPQLGDPNLRRTLAGIAFGAFGAAGVVKLVEDRS